MAGAPLTPDGDISVVVVSYRAPQVLTECLTSFERYRPRRVREVIVIDNSVVVEGTRPDERFPWITYLLNSENRHFRKAVNQGARIAGGRYLFILNPDAALVDSDSIAKLAEVLDADRRVGFAGPMVFGDDGLPAPQGERLPGIAFLFASKTYLNALWPGNPIRSRHLRTGVSRGASGAVDTVAHAAVLLRRDEFLAVGGYDERATIYWEEHELARKLRRLDRRGYYRADARIFHGWRRGGTEFDGDAATQRYFQQAMRLYYRQAYGLPGQLLFDGLDGLQAGARAVRRLALRARSTPSDPA